MILWRIYLQNKKNPVKLIVSDFDGTLKHSSHIISEKNKKIIKKFTATGGQFAIATARPFYGLLPYEKDLSDINYYILCNGAQIVHRQKSIYKKKISKKALRFLINMFWESPNIYFLFIAEEFSFTNNMISVPPFSDYQKILRSQLLSKEKIIKSDIPIFNIEVHSDYKNLLAIQNFIKKNKIKTLTPQFSWSNFMEIYSSNVSKGKALKRIQKLLHIKKSQTAAFGDGNNDIELFKQAEISVAMNNATEELKSHARFITSDCDNDGVAEFIEKYIL